jgi:hypothetical protein
MIFKSVREQKILLPHQLYFNDRIHWADLRTGAAFSACVLIYDIFLLAFFNGVCGALLGTGSARHTFIIDLIRHRSHLLTVYISIISFSFVSITLSRFSMNASVVFCT